jgi:three-Cys-motif partner protein
MRANCAFHLLLCSFERIYGSCVDFLYLMNAENGLQPSSPSDAISLRASDGLLARKSGDWAKRKLYYLRNYCGITTTAMRKKWRLLYLDVMAGPGRCKIKETGEEFPGSPFVAMDYDFHDFIFIEGDPNLADALKQRVAKHAKSGLVKVIPADWIEVAKRGELRFDDATLVVAFVDPTGISQLPMAAMLELTKNRHIDLLVTIQHSLGITLNVHQYFKSASGQTAMDAFLDTAKWREWKWKKASEVGRMAIEAFSKYIQQQDFIGTRHISVAEGQPLYRFTLFSRHRLAEKFWNEILKLDEGGQRELI